MKTTPTSILDPCCGGRMFYFDKNHPNILYCDQRSEVVEMKDRGKVRTLEINPDILIDVTRMSRFRDNEFSFVIFDPPHYINVGENSWLAKKYGKLEKDTWHETLSKGLSECLRVVKPGCIVAMKWSEGDIKTIDMLKVLPQQPTFGDKTGKTRWLFFVKDNHFGRRSNQKSERMTKLSLVWNIKGNEHTSLLWLVLHAMRSGLLGIGWRDRK